MKIAHIGIAVHNIFDMELFYKKVFCFETMYRYTSENTPGLRTVFMKKESTTIELLQFSKTGNKNELVKDGLKKGHLAFQVEDIKKEYERLLQFNIPSLKAPRNTGDGFLEFSLQDPEGNMIEICSLINPFAHHEIKAVIFDLDGTLIDSEENYYLADKKLLAEYGIDFSKEMKKKYIGRSNLEIMTLLKAKYNIAESVETLVNKKDELYLQLAKEQLVVFPEMKHLLIQLKKKNYSIAVASGSSLKIIDTILTMLDLKQYFDLFVSAEEVKHGKPEPDIFIETANRLGVLAKHILVLEDSSFGVIAARKANMYCVGIPYICEQPLADGFYMADILFQNGMKEFSSEKVMHWIAN